MFDESKYGGALATAGASVVLLAALTAAVFYYGWPEGTPLPPRAAAQASAAPPDASPAATATASVAGEPVVAQAPGATLPGLLPWPDRPDQLPAVSTIALATVTMDPWSGTLGVLAAAASTQATANAEPALDAFGGGSFGGGTAGRAGRSAPAGQPAGAKLAPSGGGAGPGGATALTDPAGGGAGSAQPQPPATAAPATPEQPVSPDTAPVVVGVMPPPAELPVASPPPVLAADPPAVAPTATRPVTPATPTLVTAAPPPVVAPLASPPPGGVQPPALDTPPTVTGPVTASPPAMPAVLPAVSTLPLAVTSPAIPLAPTGTAGVPPSGPALAANPPPSVGDQADPSWYSPGHSPGRLTLSGDFDLDGRTLLFEILGTEPELEYDVLQVGGTANLNYGNVVFAFIDAFVPASTDVFDVILADAIQVNDAAVNFYYGFFDPADDPSYDLHAPRDFSLYQPVDRNVLSWGIAGNPDAVYDQRLWTQYLGQPQPVAAQARVVAAPAGAVAQEFVPVAIPVPPTLWLLGPALLLVLGWRRR